MEWGKAYMKLKRHDTNHVQYITYKGHMTQIMKGVYCLNFKLYQNEFGLYNLTKKMCSSTLTFPPPRKSAGNPRKKNSMDHGISYKLAIFRRPLHSKGRLYISRCVCVFCVSGHLNSLLERFGEKQKE